MHIKIGLIVFLLSSFPFTSYALDPNKTYTIAFAQDTLENDFRLRQVEVVEETLKKYPNIRFIYSDAKANSALQVKQIEDFIYQKVDLLMTSPYDERAAGEVVAKAYRSGIPVVLVSRSILGNEYTSFISSDNNRIGRQAAKYLSKKMRYKGRVLLLKGVPYADSTRKRTEGFYAVMKKYPNIKVVERTGNYLRRDAIIEVDKLLQSGERFDAIMSQSDSMLVGARMALSTNGIDPASMITVGIDYIKQAQEAIRSGQQTSSFVYSLCAKKSAEVAIMILEGKKVPKVVNIDTLQVTKENVDAVKPVF